jgi:quercetin dioxygenase-like cupin family protein
MKRMIRISIAMLMPLLVLMASGAAFGQELPPGPKTLYRTSLPGQTINGEFELINIILDFDPGAATPPHTHGGPGMVTVLAEEMTFGMEGKPDMAAKPGEVYHDLPGMVHTAANKGASTSRVSYMVALPKGAALTTVVGAAQGADLPPGPKTVYRNSLPGLTMQGEFELVNLILEFAPGAGTPLHTHGGPGIVTVLEGEMVFAPEGKPEIAAKPGESYLDLPGTSHTAVNKSAARAVVSYSVLLPKGGTLTTVVAASAPTQPQAQAPAGQPAAMPVEHVGMPSTGRGDFNIGLAIALVMAVALVFEGGSRLVRSRTIGRGD